MGPSCIVHWGHIYCGLSLGCVKQPVIFCFLFPSQVSKHETDYAELIFSHRKPLIPTPGAFSTSVLHTSNTGHLQPSPNLAPSPPQRLSRSFCGDSSPSVASTAVPTQLSPTRLYPNLDAEVAKLSVQSPLTVRHSFMCMLAYLCYVLLCCSIMQS